MTPIHSDIKHFMSPCERLLGLYWREGKLTSEECDIVAFYVRELKMHAVPDRSPVLGAIPMQQAGPSAPYSEERQGQLYGSHP